MKWISDLLKNKKALQNILSGILFGVPILALLLFWGVLQHIDFAGTDLDFTTLGFVAIVFLLSGDQVKIDWRRRSKDDFEEEDEEHRKTIAECDAINFIDKDYKLGYQFVKNLNAETQLKYNVKYTEKIIKGYQKKKNKLIRKGAKISEIELIDNKIEQLEKEPLTPNWWDYKYRFTPFEYYEIISSYDNMSETVGIEDGSSIKTSPINRNRGWSFIFGIFRSTVLASVGLTVLFTVPFVQAFTILGVLILTLVLIAFIAYYFNTLYMARKVKPATVSKLIKKQDMRKYVDVNTIIEITVEEVKEKDNEKD